MEEKFSPYLRSQIWLGEPEEAAAYQEEGTKITERLRGLNIQELFDIAADERSDDRVRFHAALKLPFDDAQKLANILIQRSEDHWWASMVRLCPPTKSPETIEALQQRLKSPNRSCRHRAMQLLSKMGDNSFATNVHAMLDSNDGIERLVAISCMELVDSQESKQVLRDYATCETNPIRSRVNAATSLLRMGEKEFATLLVRIALGESGQAAYYAACSILYHQDCIEGYKLFLQILNKPDHPAKPIAVLHIANVMGNLDLGFDQAGLAAARSWLESEIDSAR